MLSFGIQFGEGFDEVTVLRMSQNIPKDYDYDFLVIGSNPGGVACAREARSAGRKTGIITWKNYSPAEAEGFDEDLDEMALALDLPDGSFSNSKKTSGTLSGLHSFGTANKTASTIGTSSRQTSSISGKGSRKVRQSRLDLNNELFKRGRQCRKLMHNAVRLGDLVEDAQNSGWRLSTTRPPLTMNWHKMSEEVMDYVMKENWTLASALGEESVELIDGMPSFQDPHTVKIMRGEAEFEYTAEIICIALSSECILPSDIPGARKYGITTDDFIRLSDPPGKTLIVGSQMEGIECAGIVACSRFPVTVISRSTVLKGYDSEISKLIMDELREKGTVFKEYTTLISVEATADKKLQATFAISSREKDEESENIVEETKETFDTILFTVGRKVNTKPLRAAKVGIEIDPTNLKIRADGNGQTAVSNIYAVGDVLADVPEDFELAELFGKLLGKRLFHEATEVMNYTMIPTVLYTPTEYAWVGITEDAAMYRLGIDCVDVYHGHFKPLDFIVPFKKGECFAKAIVLKSRAEIIGLHIYGPEAAEIIQGFAAALRYGLKLQDVRTIVGITASKARELLKLKDMRTSKKVEEEVSVLE